MVVLIGVYGMGVQEKGGIVTLPSLSPHSPRITSPLEWCFTPGMVFFHPWNGVRTVVFLGGSKPAKAGLMLQ